MRYAKIKKGVVVQVQPYHEPGFIEVHDGTVPGMLDNGDGTFSNPPPDPEPQIPEEHDMDKIIDMLLMAVTGSTAEKAKAVADLRAIKAKRP